MSIFGVDGSHTTTEDVYDHAINLVDSTKPRAEVEVEVEAEEDVEGPSDSTTNLRATNGKGIERQWTKGHLRKELARRKYAKWQEGKGSNVSTAEVSGDESGSEPSAEKPATTDISRTGRLRDKVPFRSKKRPINSNNKEDTFIDVLYENQRGSFFCGIPLYSSNSLLNFDPAGWQTSMFHDSPVNITNAQPPDPTWQWAWRTWYVDMSYDVDEEGWQYSFSFAKGWAWHGNHPWFHSFVRRRRWLRKRVKIHPHRLRGEKGDMKDGHRLTEDYFTIHAAGRDRSRESSADRTTNHQTSFVEAYNAGGENDEDPGEIGDIAALMQALKAARVDREKIVAVKAFFDHGGDELFYFAEAMPEIMDDLVHQTSRRQLQTSLLQALDEAIKQVQDDDDEDQKKAKRRRIDNLFKAVNAAGVHTNDVEYWSKLRARVTSKEADPTNETHALDAAEPVKVSESDQHAHIDDEGGKAKEEIRGIPDDAQISEEPRIQFDTLRDDSVDHDSGKTLDKGKGKA
ncbi:MAG: hypothetical protein Q9164_006741 [Protoblastenia rupestris]